MQDADTWQHDVCNHTWQIIMNNRQTDRQTCRHTFREDKRLHEVTESASPSTDSTGILLQQLSVELINSMEHSPS
jgi:hypothetical protein